MIISVDPEIRMIDHVCEVPNINIRRSRVLQKIFPNIRSKRASQNLRIYRYYDTSFEDLKNSLEFKIKVVELAIKFWEEALIAKYPMNAPILLDRECVIRYKYIYLQDEHFHGYDFNDCDQNFKYFNYITIPSNETGIKNNNRSGVYSNCKDQGVRSVDNTLLLSHKNDDDPTTGNLDRTSVPIENLNAQVAFHYVTKYNLVGLVRLCHKIEFINQWPTYSHDDPSTLSYTLTPNPTAPKAYSPLEKDASNINNKLK